jgi:hypothetical protein
MSMCRRIILLRSVDRFLICLGCAAHRAIQLRTREHLTADEVEKLIETACGGSPLVDPELMIRMLIIGYRFGIRQRGIEGEKGLAQI